MKSLYIILPALLLTAFGYIFYQDYGISAAREREQIEATEAAAKKDREEKAATERKAREDAARRAAEREAAEKKKEADRLIKWEAANADISADIATHLAKTKTQSTEIAALEKQLLALRADIVRLTRENFDLAQSNELQAIEKRNTELEAQRIINQIAHRAAQSKAIIPQPPPPPPPAR
jgi:hypothetical protein